MLSLKQNKTKDSWHFNHCIIRGGKRNEKRVVMHNVHTVSTDTDIPMNSMADAHASARSGNMVNKYKLVITWLLHPDGVKGFIYWIYLIIFYSAVLFVYTVLIF